MAYHHVPYAPVSALFAFGMLNIHVGPHPPTNKESQNKDTVPATTKQEDIHTEQSNLSGISIKF